MARPTHSLFSNFCARIAAQKAITQAASSSPSIEHIYSCVDALHIRKANTLTRTLKQEHRCDKKGMRS
jgi:hypothetical protein